MNSHSVSEDGLAGGVALVTGGSRGIGEAVVRRLAAAGMEVIFTYRENGAAAAEVCQGMPGAKISCRAVDVRDPEACAAFVEDLYDRAGRLDVLVNNAGIIRDNPLGALEPADVRTVLETNVEGVFNMTRAVVPFMIANRRGKIVNLSSVAGEKGGRGQTNYAASKGAINAFTRALAVEVGSRGITVNAVAPGVIETEMSRAVRELAGDQIKSRILLRRCGKAEEVAHAVWFLSSRYADYITGQILHVDGGFKME
jgi:3-oxoacyl-[acyl-carrier protein] reductase